MNVDGAALEYVIVGAGSAGCVLASPRPPGACRPRRRLQAVHLHSGADDLQPKCAVHDDRRNGRDAGAGTALMQPGGCK